MPDLLDNGSRSGSVVLRNRIVMALLPGAVRPNDPLRRNNVMQVLIAIIMICGACFVLLIGLLSVVLDLLAITTGHAPSELASHTVGRERAALCAKMSGAVQ
jgi:hypothetical protein